ncbi:DoxX family protein [Antrihabitans cavernicola]|uniref:DoxX family protein n=1 Tax=Antrihabitans cavernicola TaxID=2495913 RepID=A0A5A7SGJ1_9NOCA|nr:DoxX family protein [Spelaeibacter cavernicola]KAA0023807.1 DoxX family protein [Spelaeibacter cavernicola]
MNVVLWIIALLLAAVYLGAGIMKLVTPRPKLVENPNMAWAQDFSQNAIKGIGAVEVLGAAGLILPRLTGLAEVFTPLAALGLAAVQVGAIVVHYRRGETKNLPVNAVLLILALIVAFGRF